MKISTLCLLFLVLCSDSWAQLTCTNCTLAPQGGTSGSTGATVTSLTILAAPGTFTGDITLTGNSQFVITGTGQYIIEGVILQSGTENYGFTLTAPLAGGWGGQHAGLLLKGATPNTYRGTTLINGGYIACKKTDNTVAIPGDITIKAVDNSAESGLWFGANGQLGGNGLLSFENNGRNAFMTLNGTTQSLRGVSTTIGNSVIQNIESDTPGMPGIDRNTTATAILILTGTDGRYVYGGGAKIRSGGVGGLEIRVQGTSQVIENCYTTVNNVTFNGLEGSRLEFSTTTSGPNNKFGDRVIFKGPGTILKTGGGEIAFNNSTILKPAGKIQVSGGILRNEKDNNLYTFAAETNKADLQVEANATFDIWANVSIFDGLTGAGWVRNNFGSTVAGAPPGNGYSWLTLGENNSQGSPAFEGIIQDNAAGNPVRAEGYPKGGIALKKVGTGTQVLKGSNSYTGRTTVSSGTLKLQEGGRLGSGTYRGTLEISNVTAAASQAVFEHNGTQTQVFNGRITNTGVGAIKGIFLQSGSGKSIITGEDIKDFTGLVNVTGGFLGGTGNLKNVSAVTVAATGSIGGGDGVAAGGTLTVAGLSFAASSKLVVTSKSATDNAPGLVEVKERATDNPGILTVDVAGAFAVDLLSTNLVSGRLIGCTNGISGSLQLPVVGQNNTGKPVTFTWAADGLYMTITEVANGLVCNNCTFTSGTEKTGTTATPAFIITSPDTSFAGNITLTGDCVFSIIGAGNYTLSGQITGNHSLTLIAEGTGSTANTGYTAGLTLAGANANTYGSTTINSGYIICNKSSGAAIPGNMKLAGNSIQSHLWCLADNQLSENTVVDFTGTAGFHLNGTTQTIAGLSGNGNGVSVENTGANTSRPAGMTAEQVSANAATLNIKAGSGSYTYGGGGYIRKGGTAAAALTVNIMSGTQIIQNPDNHINNVTLTTATGATPEATLEFNTSGSGTSILGQDITFRGAGIIKKTGPGTLATDKATYLITAGKIWVSEGRWRNGSVNNSYAVGTETNKATLQVDAPNAVFHLMSDASIFSGLTGGGWVGNNWGQGNGYTDLTINQNDAATSATFSGVIQNNSSNGSSVSGNGDGTGGIRLRKEGNGTQVLTGLNTYTGSTTVSAGTLKLGEGGKLAGGTYGGVLEIANVPEAASQATFEHNGTQTQIFTGNMTNTGEGTTKGIFLQSGSGKSIINGADAKAFTGQVNVTGGFLGGSGSLKNATAVTLGASGSIGGGTGVALEGDTLTVAALSLVAGSKLVVSTTTGTHKRPSVVKVVTGDAAGTVTITGGFTVDIMGADLASGYILRCADGTGRPLPVLGQHSFPAGGLMPSFRWDAHGLYMETPRGLACTNCSFGSGTTAKTGTLQAPAFIRNSPGTYLSDITLNGDCQFIVTGIGNYTLSGQISGTGSLTYIANTREVVYEDGVSCGEGNSAGITLSGSSPNTYTGLTTIQSGYLICTKNNGVAAVPHNLKISAQADGPPARIWFLDNDNQLGGGSTIVDFTDTGNNSYFHLNASTQTIAGLRVNNDKVAVHNHISNRIRPIVAEWPAAYISIRPNDGVININATDNSYTFGGGSLMERGYFGNIPPRRLTINITGGTQIIENPVRVKQVDLASAGSGMMELKTTDNALYQLGGDGNNVITLKGDGTIKKTGPGTIALAHSRILKAGGKIWVFEGTLRNEGTPVYTDTGGSNKAVLEVEAPSGTNNPTFDIYGQNSIFGGLTGGGQVQNNWGPSSEGGYNYLTLNNTATSVFSGVIRDNASNNQVATGWGKGGISLKKEGTGIQALTGANLYTGTTTVSVGTLKLQGEGRLGTLIAGLYTATYGGVLEIANVAEAASQAVFEHNGTQAQIFTGNISNTGTGGTKGIFLQSGSGKSIINKSAINEIKTFTGHVNITGGFLGGSGDLRNATEVTVGAGGSIGGGDRVAANGDILTVSNLTFATADSKLIVTSTAGSTPGLSLVEVKTGAGAAGAITAANGFKVELTGTNPVSGYILKCAAVANPPTPTLVNSLSSLGATSVRFIWDTQGLWMQISFGTITLSTASSVCPGGTNPGNPAITVTATYSDERDLPPTGSAEGYFTLSNNEAKSGSIHATRVDKVVTAVFDGANTTDADLSYTITYDDQRNLAVTGGAQKINRRATLSVTSGGNPTCMGTPLVLQAAGNGTLTISSSDTNKATVGDISATSSATATTLAPGNVNFWATDGDGCKSEFLAVVVSTLPRITPENPAICKGTTLALTADHDPAAVSTTTPSAWEIKPANNAASLQDQTATDKTVNFIASEVTTQTNVTVEYTDNQGCKATTTVTINTELTLTSVFNSPVCSGTTTDILLNPSLYNTTYTWTVSENSANALPQAVAFTSNRIAQTLTNSGEAPVTVTYHVTGTSGTCTRTAEIAVVVSHTQGGAKPNVAGGGEYCVDPENKTWQTNLIPTVTEGAASVEWTYTSSFPQNQTAHVISGQSEKLVKGTLTDGAVKDNLVLQGLTPAEVCYVFRPFISCLGTPSDAVCVKIHPVPVAGTVANSAICSSSDAAHPKTNIVLSSTTTGTVVYTWTVDKANSPDVSGYNEPSREGAVVPNTNPTAATAGPVAEALLLPATAIKTQTIKYHITPWQNGCPGKAVTADVTVYPRPAMAGLSPASICTGTETNITLSNHFSEPEKHQVTYSWTVSENTVGAQPGAANQATFVQQALSLNEGATDGNVTYTFTPLYTPVAGGALSCAGQSGATVYTVVRPVVAGTITDMTLVEACFGDVITINATPADTNFQWLQNGTVISGATGSSYIVPTTAVSDAKYVARLTNACGDRDSGEKEVKVTQDAYFAGAKAEGPVNGEGEINKPVSFTYNGPPAVYSWDFDDKTAFSTDQNPSHSYVKEATYNPKLKAEKQGQAVCNKTFNLSPLKIKDPSVAGDSYSSTALSAFPIPAHDRLTIINEVDLQNITISDISGKTVMGEAVNGREVILSIGHLADGIYILTVIDSRGVRRLKISKN